MTMGVTRKHVARAAVAALAVGLVAAAPVVGAKSSGKKAPSPATVTVAAVTPTGITGLQSRLVANGAEVAARQINGAGGIRGAKVRIARIPMRAAASPASVVAAARRAKAQALVLPCNDDRLTALAKASSGAGLLTLAPCNHMTAAETPKLVWPIGPSAGAQVAQLIGYARNVRAETVYLVTPARRSAYSSQMTRLVDASAKKAKIQIVGRGTVRTDGRDVAKVEAAIDKAGPDIVLTTVGAPYAPRIITALRRKGERRPIYGTDMMDAPPFKYPFTVQDVVFLSYGFARPAATPFKRTYRRMFGAPVEGSFPGLGFEAVRVLQKGIVLAKSAAPAKVDAAMAKGFLLPGIALGDATYPGNGVREPIRNVGIAGIIRGGYQPLLASGPDRSLIAQ